MSGLNQRPRPAPNRHQEFPHDTQGMVEFGTLLAKQASAILLLWLVLSASIYFALEKGTGCGDKPCTWGGALYWAIVTFTTVGYGDFSPSTTEGKLFVIVYILASLSFMSVSAGAVLASLGVNQAKAEARQIADAEDGEFDTSILTCKHLRELLYAFAILFVVTLVGTLLLHFNEGEGWVESVYWTVVTCTTVGFGDTKIHEPSTRWFLAFFIFFGTLLYIWALGKVAQVFMNVEVERQLSKFIETGVTTTMIEEMDQDKYKIEDGEKVTVHHANGKIDKLEFLEYMLVTLNKCKRRDIRLVLKMFDDLDTSGDGFISKEDVRARQSNGRKSLRVHVFRQSDFSVQP